MGEPLTADVVIVGSGVTGALCAHALAGRGLKVLILEAGPAIDRGDAAEQFRKSPEKGPNSPYPVSDIAPSPDDSDADSYYVQRGKDPFRGLYLRGVGGTTWHWGGFTQRFRPNDFRMRTLYGQGVDWPIGYDDLDPWYEKAEIELGVSGDDSITFGGPRRVPYPMSRIEPSWLDERVARAIEPLGLTLGTFPQGRNSRDYDDRPPCCGNASCVPICPVGAKYDASVHVTKAIALGARLVAPVVVHRIVADADGRVRSVRFFRSDRSEGEASGRVFVIAAHAMESARLLLLSRCDSRPKGIANAHDEVGRTLMGQIDMASRCLTGDPVFPYRGPVMTSGILELRDGPFRSQHSAIGTSLSNAGWTRARGPLLAAEHLAARGLRGPALESQLAWRLSRELLLGSTAEMLPDRDNRVTLDTQARDPLGLPRPAVTFSIDDYARKGLAIAKTRHEQVFAALRATEVTHFQPESSTAIIAGTARMGTDPKHSVVDPDLRCHEHPNLFVVGTAVFPTVSASQPTLTASALSLRAAARIAADFPT